MCIRRASDAFGMNPFVDGSGKVGIFDEARRFAWVVVETFTFSGGLDPAVVHLKDDGSEVKFDLRQESDGSRRIMDLIPAFLELTKEKSKKVYIIDEIDRSLHTLLTRRLIDLYLSTCSTE